MKKSKIFIIVSLCFVLSIYVFCFLIYSRIFPKAPPIESAHPDTILSFTVKDYEKNELPSINIYTFYDLILNAKPTRIMSANDYPDTRPYYEVNIYAYDNRFYRYFLYSSNGNDYIEIPYVGVYVIHNFKIEDLLK